MKNFGTVFLMIVVGSVLMIGSIAGTTYVMTRTNPQQVVLQPQPAPVVKEVLEQQPAEMSIAPIVDAGVTWLSEPQKLQTDLKLFKPSFDEAEVMYYKTGSDNGQDIIIADIPPEGPGSSYDVYFLAKEDGTYEILTQHSENYNVDAKDRDGTDVFFGGEPARGVRINTEKIYRSIEDRATILYQGVPLKKEWRFDAEEDISTQRKELATTPYGILYGITSTADIPTLSTHSFVLRRPNGSEIQYQYTPPDVLLDDGVADVTWNNGEKNTTSYQLIATSGCGGGPFVPVLNEAELSKTTQIGALRTGAPVLGFANSNHAVITALYDTTNGQYYDEKGDVQKLSFSTFASKRPVMIVKDALGRYLVYNNTKYGPAVECGKPVIYLYPKQPTTVSVKVDAAIRISDPEYGNGWTVNALPDGTLYHNGVAYDSLFWEGFGKAYPTIMRGTTVAQKDLLPTLDTHLTQLGLNGKESRDFLDFWLPRMPRDPYVRLSWLTTREMNVLAPLTVSPAPDTVIRIFLDFEGLDAPVSLPSQRLSSIPRKGFTLVEWGGLLRR